VLLVIELITRKRSSLAKQANDGLLELSKLFQFNENNIVPWRHYWQ